VIGIEPLDEMRKIAAEGLPWYASYRVRVGVK
jgi:hypothetical protein